MITDQSNEVPGLAVAQLAPGVDGLFKVAPEDFEVTELLPFEPEGSGEHCYIQLRRVGFNTADLQQSIARIAGVQRHYVGYAGLKDKHGLCSQWFSVYLPGKANPDWSPLLAQGIEILNETRHRAKLRVGANRGNGFKLTLRELSGGREPLEGRLQQVLEQGFPNYFGEQRFGNGMSNLKAIADIADGPLPKQRSNRYKMLLSAARSWVFNQVLEQRWSDNNWNTILPGELVCLAGSHSYFGPAGADEDFQKRLDSFDIHPSGPLPGVGESGVADAVAALETQVFEGNADYISYIQRTQVKQARRPLRAVAQNLQWDLTQDKLAHLSFTLDSGCYATALLKAIGNFVTLDKRNIKE